MSNYEKKAQKLIAENEKETKRGCYDVFETSRGKNLLEKIRSARPKFDYLAELRIMLAIRKAYRSAADIVTGEILSGNLEQVCEDAIKAEDCKPARLLKKLLAA